MPLTNDPKTKGLYGLWKKQDIITLVYEHIASGLLQLDYETGKLFVVAKPDLDSPWYFVRPKSADWKGPMDCYRYHTMLNRLMGVMPSKCLSCWKVVVAPKTLRDMWKWREVMEEMGRHCKCGIETRPIVGRLYGSYFYNQSQEQGLECLETVLEAIERSGIEVIPLQGHKAILKRGCTEFEDDFGPSDKWEDQITDEMRWKEEMIDNYFISPPHYEATDMMKLRLFRSWVEFAFDRGDQTSEDFINPEDQDVSTKFVLKIPYVIYNPEKKND